MLDPEEEKIVNEIYKAIYDNQDKWGSLFIFCCLPLLNFLQSPIANKDILLYTCVFHILVKGPQSGFSVVVVVVFKLFTMWNNLFLPESSH